jgi:hypothetical protein
MYYILDRFGATNPCRWIDDYPYIDGVDWRSGARHAASIPNPLEVRLKPLNPDASDHGPELPEYFKGKIPLFRTDLVAAFKEAGVDNLDLYDVVITDPDNGSRHVNYKAVNIIGVISAADMEKSEAVVYANGPLIDVDFDSLTIDEKKTRGALFFRLAESTNAILVHEKLKHHLQSRGFNKLEFLNPKEVAL